MSCQPYDPSQDIEDLEVTACVEVHAHGDYSVHFAHNRSSHRPWAYPMPQEVAEFITLAVTQYRRLLVENASLRLQLERAEGQIGSLHAENAELAAELKAVQA